MGDGPYVCYKELTPASSLVGSEYFRCFNPFTERRDLYLATLSATVLNIYRVDASAQSSSLAGDGLDSGDAAADVEDLISGETHTQAALVLVRYERLFGKAKDIKAFLRSGSEESDLLILAIDEGKLVTLEFIPHENRCAECVLAHLEENAYGAGSDLQPVTNGKVNHFGTGADPLLRVSDEFKMLCAPVYGEELFFADLSAIESNSNGNNAASAAGGATITTTTTAESSSTHENGRMLCNLFKTLQLRGAVLDVCFLHGYGRPVVAILQEEQFCAVGHAKKALHTVSLCVVAVDLPRKALTLLWKKRKLPHDSLFLQELPSPSLAHCVCVIAQNALIVVGQESAHALAMNAFASITVSTQDVQLSPWKNTRRGLELDGSFWARHTPRTHRRIPPSSSSSSSFPSPPARDVVGLLGFLRDGSVLHVHVKLPIADMPSSLRIEAQVVGGSVRPSCCCVAEINGTSSPSSSAREVLVFVGTRHGQSVLYAARERLKSAPLRLSATLSENNSSAGESALSLEYTFVYVKSLRARKASDALGVDVKREKKSDQAEKEEDLSDEQVAKRMREEEKEMYGNADPLTHTEHGLSFSPAPSLAIDLHKLDTIDVLGAVLHGTATKADELFSQVSQLHWERNSQSSSSFSSLKPLHTVASYIPEKESKEALVVTSGLDEDAMLNRVFSGVGLGKVGVRSFPGATRLFSCAFPTHTVLLVSYENKTRVLQCSENKLQSEHAQLPDLRMLEVDADDAGFVASSSTLGLAVIHRHASRKNKNNNNKYNGNNTFNNNRQGNDKEENSEHQQEEDDEEEDHSIAVQVFPFGVRLLRVDSSFAAEHEPLQDLLLADSLDVGGLGGRANELIITADFCRDFVVLMTNLQTMTLLRYLPQDHALEVVAVHESSSQRDKEGENERERQVLSFLDHDVVSASLFHGECEFATQSPSLLRRIEKQRERQRNRERERQRERDSPLTSAVQREERELYGAPLSTEDSTCDDVAENAQSQMDVVSMGIIEGEGEGEGGKHQHDRETDSQKKERAVLVIADTQSQLFFVDAETLSLLWSTREMGLSAQSVAVSPKANAESQTQRETESETNYYIVESKLCRLSFSPCTAPALSPHAHTHTHDKLVLLLLLHTGQLIVYDAVEVSHTVVSFCRSLSRTIINKRVAPHANLQAGDVSAEEIEREKQQQQFLESVYLRSEDYFSRGNSLLPLQSSSLSHTQYSPQSQQSQLQTYFPSEVVLVGDAAEPLLLAVVKGHNALFPLDFPETPYVNAGVYAVRPLVTPSLTLFATMWHEFEDLDALKNAQHMQMNNNKQSRASRPSTLGVYRVLPRQVFSAYGQMTRQCMGVHQTVHKCQELLRLTDDSTEQALLENKKTFVLLCSREKNAPFSPHVVELNEYGEDAENTEEMGFERYFAEIFKSFAQPDTQYAPAPEQHEREYRIALVQNGKVMDCFTLDTTEKVLDMSVVYFTAEKEREKHSHSHSHHSHAQSKIAERRVYVVVSTVYVDKHGEDTQGNGRLLLLSLDYAMFGGAEEKSSSSSAFPTETMKDEEVDAEADAAAAEEDENTTAAADTGDSGTTDEEMKKESKENGNGESDNAVEMEVEGVTDPQPVSAKKIVRFNEGNEIEKDNTVNDTTVAATPVNGSGAAQKASDKNSASAASTTNGKSLSSAQQQFLGSIQPKLRQIWSGTGPASVVQQVPNIGMKDASTAFSSLSSHAHHHHAAAANNPWSNYLVATVGYILYVYKFNSVTSELDQVAFFFAQFYVTSVSIVKNYIIIADMFHSVQLLYFREEDYSIHLIAKDFDHRVITKTDLMVDGSKFGIVTADDRGNVQLFQENPKKGESLSGSRLLNIGDFHLGSEASMLLSHELLYAEPHAKRSTPLFHVNPGMPMPPPPPPPPKARRGSSFPLQSYGTRFFKQQFVSNASLVPGGVGASKIRNRRVCTLVGTMDGALGCLLPVEEKMYKRLSLLQQIMTMLLPSALALNPKDFRAPKGLWCKYPFLQNTNSRRIVLDGCLIYKYLSLDTAVQEELAHIIGASAQVLRENLHELEAMTRFF